MPDAGGKGSRERLCPFPLQRSPAIGIRGNMPELRISTEKLCALIEAAREIAGKVASTTGDRTSTGDDSKLETIVDDPGQDIYEGDDRRRQMVEFIAGLNVEEQTDLLALIWLGRGDYDIADWDDALEEAEARI